MLLKPSVTNSNNIFLLLLKVHKRPQYCLLKHCIDNRFSLHRHFLNWDLKFFQFQRPLFYTNSKKISVKKERKNYILILDKGGANSLKGGGSYFSKLDNNNTYQQWREGT